MKSLAFEGDNQYPCDLDECIPDGIISIRDSVSMISLAKRILLVFENNIDFSFPTVHQSIATVVFVWAHWDTLILRMMIAIFFALVV